MLVDSRTLVKQGCDYWRCHHVSARKANYVPSVEFHGPGIVAKVKECFTSEPLGTPTKVAELLMTDTGALLHTQKNEGLNLADCERQGKWQNLATMMELLTKVTWEKMKMIEYRISSTIYVFSQVTLINYSIIAWRRLRAWGTCLTSRRSRPTMIGSLWRWSFGCKRRRGMGRLKLTDDNLRSAKRASYKHKCIDPLAVPTAQA